MHMKMKMQQKKVKVILDFLANNFEIFGNIHLLNIKYIKINIKTFKEKKLL